MSNIIELVVKCNYCKREILEEMAYYKHPIHGIVCERCGPFKDGGISLNEDPEDEK